MPWWMVAVLIVLAVIVLGRLFGSSGDVEPARARELVQNGATLVDVRSPGEFSSGHIDGAINVPVGDIERHLDRIPKDKPVILYCASGMRSSAAAATLKGKGYTEVFNLGPMSRW
ncbi:MAG: rhodanese-like domain-containing protein [Polyangiaceae bacterium]